ncbi:MAG: MarR family transcriptional regulator [Deltaproteobacteria bacterium]|nr:MarR family transcriptional regulator [Deltaproteobacteria bacterium]
MERPELAHEVLTAIRQIVRRVSEHSKQLSREVGLTVPQLLCLKAIGEAGAEEALTLAGLAQRVQLSSATVSRIIDRLVRAGLVSRERGTTDRRLVRIRLTEAGEDRFESLPKPLQEEFLQKLYALPAEEREELVVALQRIADLMGAAALDVSPILVADDAAEE